MKIKQNKLRIVSLIVTMFLLSVGATNVTADYSCHCMGQEDGLLNCAGAGVEGIRGEIVTLKDETVERSTSMKIDQYVKQHFLPTVELPKCRDDRVLDSKTGWLCIQLRPC